LLRRGLRIAEANSAIVFAAIVTLHLQLQSRPVSIGLKIRKESCLDYTSPLYTVLMAPVSKEEVLPPWGLAAAGAAGAIVANALVYPLDM